MFDTSDPRFGWCDGAPAAAPAPAPAPAVAVQNAATVQLSGLQSWEQLLGEGAAQGLSAEKAMRHGAFYACVRVIAGTIAQLPFKTFRSNSDGTTIENRAHRYAKLLRLTPNPRMTAAMYWRTSIAGMLTRGNSYAWIERNRSGDALALWPIPRGRVSPWLSDSGPTKGRIQYDIGLDDGTFVVADMDDVLHFPGSMALTANGLEAMSPLSAFASSVNIGMEANDFAQRYLENDATPPVFLKTEKKISKETANEIREVYQANGVGKNRGKLRILSEGMGVEFAEISADDAQLLETRKASAIDVAMMMGVPPHMIGAIDKQTSWGTGVEQQSIGFVTYTLGMHINAIEQELERKLFRDDGHHCEVNVSALVRGDIKARYEAYRSALGRAGEKPFMRVNEVRRLENLEPDDSEFGESLEPIAATAPATDTKEKDDEANATPPKSAGDDGEPKGASGA